MNKIVIILVILFCTGAHCQPIDSLPHKTASVADTTFTTKDPVEDVGAMPLKFYSSKEFLFGVSILVTLVVILPLLIWVIKTKNLSDDLTVKLLLTTIVIICTLFLVVAGFDDKSIAPAFGLFGAILGYVFGKSENKNT